MVDLAHLSPEQKSLVIRGDANYQFVYVNHQPAYVNRINQELADKIGEMYNGSAMHARILEMHAPLMQLIQETNLDNVSLERIVPIMQNLITYDYTMFMDLMTILAAMLEAKDVEMKSNHIDFTIECSDQIVALAAAREAEAAAAVEAENTSVSEETSDDDYVTVDEEAQPQVVEEEEEECGNGPVPDNEEPCDPQMSPDE